MAGSSHGNFSPSNQSGSTCQIEDKRTVILALRNSGDLNKDCHYVITDYSRGTVGAAKILLHAVDANTLSQHASVITTHDNTAWEGRYDIDTNRLMELNDERGNEVSGQETVDTFPWGVASVTDNKFFESQLDYTGGTVKDVTATNSSKLTISGGTLSDTTIDSKAQVTIISGANLGNTFSGGIIYKQVGSGYVRDSRIMGIGSWIVGDTNINSVDSIRTNLDTTGSTGAVTSTRFHNANAARLKNIDSLTISLSSIDNNSIFACDGAAYVSFVQSSMSDFARLLVSQGAIADVGTTHLSNQSYIQATNGRINCSNSIFNNFSYLLHSSTGTNTVQRTQVTSQSSTRFTDSCDGCSIYYSVIGSGSIAYHSGTSKNCYMYNLTAMSSSTAYTRNSVNARLYYNSLDGASQIYSQNVTGTHYIYFCVGSAHGYLRMVNGSGGRMYGVKSSAQSIVQMNNNTPASRLYYSSFHAYYYLYITLTATRSALHGYGRRSYTVTNPPNGTYSQNF